jgi:hypothetical protein
MPRRPEDNYPAVSHENDGTMGDNMACRPQEQHQEQQHQVEQMSRQDFTRMEEASMNEASHSMTAKDDGDEDRDAIEQEDASSQRDSILSDEPMRFVVLFEGSAQRKSGQRSL